MNLLVRLYDYASSIQIGGVELRELNRDAVRRAFGMVLGLPFLYCAERAGECGAGLQYGRGS